MAQLFDKNNIDIVIYHGHCSDGFGSAFVIWNYYKQLFGLDRASGIKYIPAVYQKDFVLTDNFVEEMTGKNIIMCDFSYRYQHLKQIIDVANSFIILDHHKTAEKELAQVPDNLKIFDMKRSGCGITWDYFYPTTKIPKFLAHIQDRDLWTYMMPESATYVKNTAEFVAFFYEQKFDFDLWETFLDDTVTESAINTGRAWLEYKNICVDKIARKASHIIQEINNQYFIGLYVNTSDLKSDIGDGLLTKYWFGDYACIWNYDKYRNESVYSLRSTDFRSDVSKLALNFGGGGHRNASGICFDGVVTTLPYPNIDDHGIIKLLLHNKRGSRIRNNVTETYTLISVPEVKNEWFETKYMHLLKRKFKDSLYIVFETNTICAETLTPKKQFQIIFNEKSSILSLEKQLLYSACYRNNTSIVFVTDKEFDNFFSTMGTDSNFTTSDESDGSYEALDENEIEIDTFESTTDSTLIH